MKTPPQEQQSLPAAVPPANLLQPSLTSIRERQALDTLINMGLLLEKKLDSSNTSNVFRYYDSKGELLLTKHITQWGDIQYEVYKIGRAEFTDDLNYDQIPKLLVITTTDKRINIEHYIPGGWEARLAKLAEGKLNGEDKRIPKIQKSPRSPKVRPKG